MNDTNGNAGQSTDFPTRILGRTGERVSALGLGGAHIGKSQPNIREAIRIIRTAIDSGLTFMDNSWDYNGGESEIRVVGQFQERRLDK